MTTTERNRYDVFVEDGIFTVARNGFVIGAARVDAAPLHRFRIDTTKGDTPEYDAHIAATAPAVPWLMDEIAREKATGKVVWPPAQHQPKGESK